MTGWRTAFIVAIVLACGGTATAATNEDVMALTKAKVGDEAILARIANQPCRYQLEIKDIAGLRKAGVTGPVIAAMIRRCAAEPSAAVTSEVGGAALSLRPGIYAVESGPLKTRYEYIVPAVVATGQAGGTGTVLLPFKSRITLPGASGPPLALSKRPSFWIVSAPAKRQNQSAGGQESLPAAFSDIRLARLEQKADRRQLQVGSLLNKTAIAEIDPKRIVPLQIGTRSSAIQVLEPERDLEPGQYALVVKDGASAFRMYDFSIP